VAPLEAARDALLRRPAQNRSERTQAERGRLALAEAKAALR